MRAPIQSSGSPTCSGLRNSSFEKSRLVRLCNHLSNALRITKLFLALLVLGLASRTSFDTSPDPNANNAQPWNYGFYFVANQMLYRGTIPKFAPVADNNGEQISVASPTNKGLGVFTHMGLSPQNSSFFNFYIDGGLT